MIAISVQDREIENKLAILNAGDKILAPRKIQKRNERIGVFGVHLTDNTWMCNWCVGIPYEHRDEVVREQTALGVRVKLPKYCPRCYTILEMRPKGDYDKSDESRRLKRRKI